MCIRDRISPLRRSVPPPRCLRRSLCLWHRGHSPGCGLPGLSRLLFAALPSLRKPASTHLRSISPLPPFSGDRVPDLLSGGAEPSIWPYPVRKKPSSSFLFWRPWSSEPPLERAESQHCIGVGGTGIILTCEVHVSIIPVPPTPIP